MGVHLSAVDLDTMIQFSTLSRKSGFLWHSSKWACRFSHYLQYTSGIEVSACSLYTGLNYVTTTLHLHPSLIHSLFMLSLHLWIINSVGVLEHPQISQLCWCSLYSIFHRLYSLLGSCVIVAYRAPNWRKPATCKHFFFKTSLFEEWIQKFVALLTKEKWQRMNREMLTPTFFELYTVYIENLDNSFCILYLLTCLNRDASSCYKYFNKFIRTV